MATAQQVLALLDRYARADHEGFVSIAKQIEASERANNHISVADKLSRVISLFPKTLKTLPHCDSLVEVTPSKTLNQLQLDWKVIEAVQEIIEEQKHSDLLEAHLLAPRRRVLFYGPSGNGKTSLAGAIAAMLDRPLYVFCAEKVLDSHLGVSAQQLGKLFDAIEHVPCVLFLDELDSIGSARSHGGGAEKENARIVNTLLTRIDRTPPSVFLVGATNMLECLDYALLRRFEITLELPCPDYIAVTDYLMARLNADKEISASDRRKFEGVSYAEIENLVDDIRRRAVITGRSHGDLWPERLQLMVSRRRAKN